MNFLRHSNFFVCIPTPLQQTAQQPSAPSGKYPSGLQHPTILSSHQRHTLQQATPHRHSHTLQYPCYLRSVLSHSHILHLSSLLFQHHIPGILTPPHPTLDRSSPASHHLVSAAHPTPSRASLILTRIRHHRFGIVTSSQQHPYNIFTTAEMHYTAISGIYTVTRQSKSHCDLCYAYPPHIPDICTVFCRFMLLSATPDCTYTRFSPPNHVTMTGHRRSL